MLSNRDKTKIKNNTMSSQLRAKASYHTETISQPTKTRRSKTKGEIIRKNFYLVHQLILNKVGFVSESAP